MEKIDWDDVTIIPDVLSDIESRGEINPYLKNGNLPLFTAPMDMVIDEYNVSLFDECKINICLPRNIKYEVLKNNKYFYSYGLDEIIDIMNDNQSLPRKVLIDVANGNMLKLYNVSKRIKERFGSNIELMVGNIANPETYRKYCEIGVDYIRCGIGGGSACHVGDTLIKTIDGDKRLDDIIVGDIVFTHKGRYKKVTDLHILKSNDMFKLNSNVVTGNHKYYVIDKKFISIIDDNNIEKYAEWISVDMLNNNYFLLSIDENV